jgi:methyl-accepting chemotaxis protein
MILTVAVIAGISTILLSRAGTLQEEAAEENPENMTGLYARQLEIRYQVYLDVMQSLSQIMNGYESVDPAVRRTRVNTINGQNKENIDILVWEVSKFKVE